MQAALFVIVASLGATFGITLLAAFAVRREHALAGAAGLLTITSLAAIGIPLAAIASPADAGQAAALAFALAGGALGGYAASRLLRAFDRQAEALDWPDVTQPPPAEAAGFLATTVPVPLSPANGIRRRYSPLLDTFEDDLMRHTDAEPAAWRHAARHPATVHVRTGAGLGAHGPRDRHHV